MENTNVRSKEVRKSLGLLAGLKAIFGNNTDEKVDEKIVEKFNSNLEGIVLSARERKNANSYRVDGGAAPVRSGREKTNQRESRSKRDQGKGLEH